jgi:hypothetical protein
MPSADICDANVLRRSCGVNFVIPSTSPLRNSALEIERRRIQPSPPTEGKAYPSEAKAFASLKSFDPSDVGAIVDRQFTTEQPCEALRKVAFP